MGVTQAELADVLEVDRAAVCRWERGANPPKFAELILRRLKALAKKGEAP